MSHQCPGLNCAATVPTSQVACRAHWYSLPKPLRDRIWWAYRSGNTDEHHKALMEALEILSQD